MFKLCLKMLNYENLIKTDKGITPHDFSEIKNCIYAFIRKPEDKKYISRHRHWYHIFKRIINDKLGIAQVILNDKYNNFVRIFRGGAIYKKLCDFEVRLITPNRKYNIPLNINQKLYWYYLYVQNNGHKNDIPSLPPEIWENIFNYN